MSSLAPVSLDRRAGLASVPRRRFLIVHNPTAGARRTRRLCRLIGVLDQRFGAEVTVVRTTGRGDAERIARTTAPGIFDAIVAAGGDGTINEVINGLADSDSGMPLGLVPLGTANVLANELGLGEDVEFLADVLVRGTERAVNLGRINGRRFAMMAGAGLDAQVVERIDPKVKKWLGKGAYVAGTLARLVSGDSPAFRVTIGERSWNAASVIVSNGRFYGGRFVCAPEASLFADNLHVCLFPRRGRLNALRYIWGVTAGRLDHFGDYRVIPTDHLTLSGPPGEAVQADGDIIGHLPVTITLERDRLPMLMGA